MEIVGKLTAINPIEKGESKAGKEWTKQSIVIDNGDKYNPNVCVSFFGDKTDLLTGVNVGDDVTVSINLSSREFNGKWYHSIDGWKIEGGDRATTPPIEGTKDENGVDDLPW